MQSFCAYGVANNGDTPDPLKGRGLAVTVSYIVAIITFTLGLLLGWAVNRATRQPAATMLAACGRCLEPHELAGLIASVVVPNLHGMIPGVVYETDKTIVFKHPRPKHRIHYILVPKRDIKNIGELSHADKEFLLDLFDTLVVVINKEQLRDYRLWSNGPAKQDVAYLHFHLAVD